MMSQIEIRNMQDYCLRRNHEQDRRDEGRGFSLTGLLIFIMGLVILAMSVMLTAYVLWVSVAMTGVPFLITGVAGSMAGIGAMILAGKLA